MYQVDNAVIMAAGVSSRFAPLSYEKPKALIEVKGEILIERQIRQLQEVGIRDIYIVTGYKAEQFEYLQDTFGVRLIRNPAYLERNNHSSIYAAKDVIRNTYICSADNYFVSNPFERQVAESYYAAVYADGETNEWCMETDADDCISGVTIGGSHAWYMLGHAFWSEKFSSRILQILEAEYDRPETKPLFWENIFMNHMDELKMRIRRYPDDCILEFDSLAELREFDQTYVADTRSAILKEIAGKLQGTEAEIREIEAMKGTDAAVSGIRFRFRENWYTYAYSDRQLRREKA